MRILVARLPLLAVPVVLAALVAASCGGGGALTDQQARTAGEFLAMDINIREGEVWELNRPIRIEFNHPIDPQSISYSSVTITGISPGVTGRPVTGSFEIEAGSDDRVLVFRPSCPTNDANDNGAFLPGGHTYRIELPTRGSFGSTVLRDTAGHQLKQGLSRTFRTPTPPVEPLFLDVSPLPAAITGIDWPERLNMFTDPEPVIAVHFDQPIDGRSSNLNTSRLYVQYSDELASAGGTPTFPDTNRVPGTVVLAQNCTKEGATVYFQISGLLPPDRSLRLVLTNGFLDIAGQSQIETWYSPVHVTPTLETVYGAAALGFTEADPTLDEFSDFFADSSMIDPDADLTLPPAEWSPGGVSAGFDFPGRYVAEDEDFFWNESFGEVRTDGQTILTDSNNRSFTVQNGVLYVNDFEIAAGATLRGRGSNPLIIYATGDVRIYGTIDVSGNDSHWPTSLNSPQFPEGPVLGECGGGLGGIASREGLKETLRGDPGDGPFGFVGAGGGGGEGGFQQSQNVGSSSAETANLITGGGGGGTFAKTPNLAINIQWPRSEHRPNGADNIGPDHDPGRSPYWPDGVRRDTVDLNDFPVYGGEDGMRGSSAGAPKKGDPFDPRNPPSMPHGVYGMEDEMIDQLDPQDPNAGATTFDPYWDTPTIPFDYGHPTDGPDPGKAGGSVFSNDGTTANDFFGSRYDPKTGTVIKGELLAPWAGSGGGASGDSQVIPRPVVNGQMGPLIDAFPARPFPPSGGYYRKGAPGGGGGGQLQILAIGKIVLGNDAKIDADGGIGHGGESTLYSYGQVSGSGGGSGGHIILHTASKLDLLGVYLGSGSQFSDLTPRDLVRAVGGRRGWAASWCSRIRGTSNTYDGNGDLMIGRGGAGGNGVIQFHIPDPANDIIWPISSRTIIRNYIHDGDYNNNPLNADKLEEALDLIATPKPYALIPFFSSQSQVQSKWIDTGLAGLRDPANGTGPYPDWASAMAAFAGINTSNGKVSKQGAYVKPLANIVSFPVADAAYSTESVVISGAAGIFAGQEWFLRVPGLLVGYDLLPDETAAAKSYEVTGAEYDPVSDELTLTTSSQDGSLLFAVNPPNNSALRPKFFRISTTGTKDYLPASTAVTFEFQGADDPDDPGSYTLWVTDLSLLKGKRAVRYRVSFDIDALDQGVSQANPRPQLEYVKIPFEW
ncbi:MAG: hypothetical protein D6702_03135 [Planctomycetota bacterium]|nr:MAG: hypothetical protein D6702_03135 [Planctomycetota bacterium]